jgi:signal transduction histidine kinase
VTNQDLRRSRWRIVKAREEERRRIRRDLHDGLGPALANQSMLLQHARTLLRTSPAEVDAVLETTIAQVRSDLVEIRRLVDDLRPKVLDQLGLVSALREHAAASTIASGLEDDTRMSWSVSASGDLDALPAGVEVAVYRIVREAVNNAARHGRASHCDVRLFREGASLLVTVSDDGTGITQSPTKGVGLDSMRERAEELDGTFTLSPGPRGGTTIRVRLPLETD